jgi:hypothetical protein
MAYPPMCNGVTSLQENPIEGRQPVEQPPPHTNVMNTGILLGTEGGKRQRPTPPVPETFEDSSLASGVWVSDGSWKKGPHPAISSS